MLCPYSHTSVGSEDPVSGAKKQRERKKSNKEKRWDRDTREKKSAWRCDTCFVCSFCEHTKWESLVGHRVSHVLLEDILRSLYMFLPCVGSARYVRGFTCFISHNNKKLKFFCCQFTIDHNQGILFKAFRCKQCSGAIGGGMDPNKSSSKDKKKKKKIFKESCFCLGEEK